MSPGLVKKNLRSFQPGMIQTGLFNLRSFQPGMIQTGLYSLRNASNLTFRFRKKGNSTACVATVKVLIFAFVFHKKFIMLFILSTLTLYRAYAVFS